MTKKELLKGLLKIKESETSGTADCTHADADELLIEYIDDEGVKEAFKNLTKWYS